MTQVLKVAAVGDILMWGKQIASARKSGGYSFDSMFKEVAPHLKDADLTIGNLETTFSGREARYQRKNTKTGYPMFNCPDELASTLRRSGFHVLTTANNHCMDRGIDGLRRTLNILDQHGIDHTGTFRSRLESEQYLMKEIKGVRLGILAYTYNTNYIDVPKSKSWAVNIINQSKILRDIRHIRKSVDLIIIALHFGREFHRYPSNQQKNLVRLLMKNGADVVLGCHPHVLQPMAHKNGKFVIYSLGNFSSLKMWNKLGTESGVIVKLLITKENSGRTYVSRVTYVPTWTQARKENGRFKYRVLPVRKFIRNPDAKINKQDGQTLRKVWRNTTAHLKGKAF